MEDYEILSMLQDAGSYGIRGDKLILDGFEYDLSEFSIEVALYFTPSQVDGIMLDYVTAIKDILEENYE